MDWDVVIQFEEQLKNGEAIANIWTIEDVKRLNNSITDEDAAHVLYSVMDNFDEDTGINWGVIDTHLNHYINEHYD